MQFKPIIKDISTDMVKDVLADQTFRAKDIITDQGTPKAKDIATDPLTDKALAKDPPKDFNQKEFAKDPIKDVATDGILDPINTFFNDPGTPGGGGNTGIADTIAEGTFTEGGGTFAEGGGFDPGQVVTNPVTLQQNLGQPGTPFVMATPHHAPAHLLAMQAGIQQPGVQAAAGPGGKQLTQETGKELASDTLKEPQFDTLKEMNADTGKELIKDPPLDTTKEIIKDPSWDTSKEMLRDTRKELVYETWVEGGPFTAQEGTLDPGGLATQPPVWNLPGTLF